MDFINAAILGVVEGITEFLPISSTGHLIIVDRFVNFSGPFAKMFDIVIQLGAILAVVVYFWNRLWPFGAGKNAEERTTTLSIWKKTLAGVIPAIIIGAALAHKIEEKLFNPKVVAGALIIGGIIIIIIESRKKRNARFNDIAGLSYGTAVAIGFCQCLAMIPGTSRSAATIIGAMLLGASRIAAAEFSFFLAVPTMVAATAYSLMKHHASITAHQAELVAVGFVVSFFVAWAVIAAFMNFIRKHDFRPFGYYRLALGALIIVLVAKHVITGGAM